MLLEFKEYQRLTTNHQKPREIHETDFFSEPSEKANLHDTWILELAFRTVRQYVSICLSHPVYGTFLQQS